MTNVNGQLRYTSFLSSCSLFHRFSVFPKLLNPIEWWRKQDGGRWTLLHHRRIRLEFHIGATT